jgi:hypothetical protein
MTKRCITENITSIDLDSMDCIYTDIDYFISIFAKIKEEYPNDKIAVCFNKSESDGSWDDYESNTLDITLNRLETDKEYDNRIKSKEKAKERLKQKKQQDIEKKRLEKEANDKKEYLRLKKKYGGKT